MDEFIVSSGHAEDLADGRSIASGAQVSLSAEEQKDPHNAAIIADGRLSPVPGKRADTAPDVSVADAVVTPNNQAPPPEPKTDDNAEEGEHGTS